MASKNKVKNKRKQAIPFWSFNDKLVKSELLKQIRWMDKQGYGGFFMHARSGLSTEYLSEEWFDCIKACAEEASKLGMEAWLYDENGWPSGFAGGKLLEDESCLENYLTYSIGSFDKSAFAVYDIGSSRIVRISADNGSDNLLNVFKNTSVSTVDILDDKVVDKFIRETHEVYNKEFGFDLSASVSGFFTDEPQYFGGSVPFPHLIADVFRDKYGIDIIDKLGLLFVEKEDYEDFRYKYYFSCQHLFLNNYSKKIYEWCCEHNVKLTGHYVEEADISKQMYHCAGVMPFYEFEHIPAIDWLCRRFMSVVPIKQLVSACAQLNKSDVMTECFAMTGWDVTPLELKAIAEFQYIYGVNMMCNHLLPYSEVGFRKNDYPTHFSKTNAWAESVMPKFNEYFDKLGDLIKNSKESVDVAVLHPLRSGYITFKHKIIDEHDRSLISFCDELCEMDIAFHFLDETLLEKYGSVFGKNLCCGSCKYAYVILPPDILSISKTTDELLKKFVSGGGKLIVTGKPPVYLEGTRHSFDYIKSNSSIEEIVAGQAYSIVHKNGKIRSALRKTADFSFISVLNIDGKNKADCKISLKSGRVKEYNVVTNEVTDCSDEFVVKPYESKYFVICNDGLYVGKKEKETIRISGEFEVKSFTDNYLVLDMAEFSYDGIIYSEKHFIPSIFDQLLQDRYQGDVYLKFTFDCDFIAKDIKLMYDNCQETIITVNGHNILFDKASAMDKGFLLGDIADFVKIGKNEIIQKINFYQKKSVYYALFGENVTESLKNCIVYDTYIDSLRIVGHFGVYEKIGLEKSALENVFIGKDFIISKPAEAVRDLISDGFLFFAGRITLKKTVVVDSTNVRIQLTGRIHYAKIYVNGQFAGEFLFNDTMDISKYLIVGENVFEIELTTGSRNLFGPFHVKNREETFHATPHAFTFTGHWKDFKCDEYRESYSFVKTGIFDYDGQFRLLLDS